MLNAAYVDNGVEGLDRMFQSHDRAQYTALPVTADFAPDLVPYDLLIVPNGCDSIAMARIADQVQSFLSAGKTLFCFDGWTTSWLPGNRWVYDCEKPTRDIRYYPRTDRHDMLHNVPIDELIYMHGISGWWACGYIEPAQGADVLLADTWDRAVIVLDEKTTRGTMIMTASGPLGDCDLDGKENGLTRLYRNMLDFAAIKIAAVG